MLLFNPRSPPHSTLYQSLLNFLFNHQIDSYLTFLVWEVKAGHIVPWKMLLFKKQKKTHVAITGVQ